MENAQTHHDERAPIRRRLVGVLLLGIIIVALSASAAVHGALVQLLQRAEGVLGGHPVAGPLVFVLLAAISALLAFFSSAPLVPAGVVTWGMATTALLLAGGWLLGGVCAYAVARWIGRPAVERLAHSAQIARWEALLGAHTRFGVIVLFQLAFPSEVPGYVLGLVRYPLARYVTALLLVEGPFAAVTVWMGEEFVARRLVPVLGTLAGLALVGGAAGVWLHRRLAPGVHRSRSGSAG